MYSGGETTLYILPLDIKSYRTIQYSLLFHKLPGFLAEAKKLLFGAIDGSVKFGNPVSDYIPDFFTKPSSVPIVSATIESTESNEYVYNNDDDEGKGYLDYFADIADTSDDITEEINAMGVGMRDMTQSISQATNEINRVKEQSGSADPSFVRSICRKLAIPIESNAEKMRIHISTITSRWSIVENSYLSLLDNHFIQKKDNLESIESSATTLAELRDTITGTDSKIDDFISVLQTTVGVERRLTKAVTKLIAQLEAYLSMTDTMSSSIERIISKSEVVISSIKNSAN